MIRSDQSRSLITSPKRAAPDSRKTIPSGRHSNSRASPLCPQWIESRPSAKQVAIQPVEQPLSRRSSRYSATVNVPTSPLPSYPNCPKLHDGAHATSASYHMASASARSELDQPNRSLLSGGTATRDRIVLDDKQPEKAVRQRVSRETALASNHLPRPPRSAPIIA